MKKMTADEFDNIFYSTDIMDRYELWNHIDSLQSELEALEGRKGFVVDWDSFGDSVKGLVTITTTLDEAGASGYGKVIQYIPRPLRTQSQEEQDTEQVQSKMVQVCYIRRRADRPDKWQAYTDITQELAKNIGAVPAYVEVGNENAV